MWRMFLRPYSSVSGFIDFLNKSWSILINFSLKDIMPLYVLRDAGSQPLPEVRTEEKIHIEIGRFGFF
jgi:hypothetical protein